MKLPLSVTLFLIFATLSLSRCYPLSEYRGHMKSSLYTSVLERYVRSAEGCAKCLYVGKCYNTTVIVTTTTTTTTTTTPPPETNISTILPPDTNISTTPTTTPTTIPMTSPTTTVSTTPQTIIVQNCECYEQFYTGTDCRDEKDYCEPSPCKNNAICVPIWGNFFCKCDNKYLHEGDGVEVPYYTSGVNCGTQISSAEATAANRDRVRFKAEVLFDLDMLVGEVVGHVVIIQERGDLGVGNPDTFYGTFSNGGDTFSFKRKHMIKYDLTIRGYLKFQSRVKNKWGSDMESAAFVYHCPYPAATDNLVVSVELFNDGEKQFDGKYRTKATMIPLVCTPRVILQDCGASRDTATTWKRQLQHTIRSKASPHCPEVPDADHEFITDWKLYKITDDLPFPTWVPISLNNEVQLDPSQQCCSIDLVFAPFKINFGLFAAVVKVKEQVLHLVKKSGHNYATCWFTVERQPAEAKIRGGARRKLWMLGEILLDGSASHDPNETPDNQHLDYAWSCERHDNASDTFCKGLNETIDNKKVCTVPPKALKPGLYSFQLKVRPSAAKESEKVDGFAKQTINVDDSTSPTELQIECVKNCDPEETSNPTEVVQLHALCLKHCKGSKDKDYYTWTLEGKSAFDWAKDTEFGNKNEVLAILENVLKDGESYTFVLTGGTGTGAGNSGEASYTVKTTKRPGKGTCKVEPTSGDFANTRFKISCSGFSSTTGNDANLNYYVYQSTGLNQSALGVLMSYGNVAERDSLELMQGNKLTIKVKDESGMFVLFDLPVSVTAPPLDLTMENITDIILGKGNLTSLLTMITGGATSSAVRMVTSLSDALGKLDAVKENVTDRELHLFKTRIKAKFLWALNEVPLHTTQAVSQVASALHKIIQTDLNSTDHRSAERGSAVMIRLAHRIHSHTSDELDSQRLNTAELKEIVVHVMECVDTIFSENTRKIIMDPEYGEDPQESEYGHYFYLDNEFVERTGDFNYATANIFTTLNMLGRSLGHRQNMLLRYTHLRANDVSMFIKHDRPTNMAGQYFGGSEDTNPDVGMLLSNSLAQQLERQSHVVNLQVTICQKNPLWFKAKANETNSIVMLMHMETVDEEDEVDTRHGHRHRHGRSVEIIQLPEPVDIYMKIAEQNNTEPVKSNVSVDASATPEDVEYMIGVHRVDMYKGSYLYLDFEKPDDKLDVVVVQGTRPTIEDFEEAITIPREDAADVDKLRVLFSEQAVADVWFYVGVLPHHRPSLAGRGPGRETNTASEVTYAFQIYKARCCFWNTGSNQWDTEGCEIGTNYTLTRLHCRCAHLSVFSGSIIVAPNKVDPFNDIDLFLTFTDNPLVVSMVVTILVIYLLLLILLRICDRRDLKQRGITVLEDNRPGDQYAYLVTVYTGRRADSGTSSNIGITLVGDSLKGKPHLLIDSNRPVHQRNTDCWFLLLTSRCLGEMQTISLWSDNSGHSPAWYCLKVVVTDLEREQAWVFLVDRWLSVSHGDGTVSCEVPVATERELSSWKYLFTDHANLGFREDHLWFSIVLRHPRSSFTRCQRMSVAVCLLMLAMLANLMFYGIPRNEPADHFDIGNFQISTREFIIPLEAALVTVPISMMIVILFRKTKPSDETSKTKAKPNTAAPQQAAPGSSKKPQEDVKPRAKGKAKSRSRRATNWEQIREQEDMQIEPKIVRRWAYQLHATPGGSKVTNTAGAGERRKTFTSPSQIEGPNRRRSQLARGVLNVLMMDPLAPASSGTPETSTRKKRNANDENGERSKRKRKSFSPCCRRKSSDEETGDQSHEEEHFGGQAYWFPSWCIYIAWSICILTMLVAAFFVSLYGLSFGYNKSLLWLTSIGIFFLQSIFIIQPIKVILFAIILALIFKKKPKTFNYECTPSAATLKEKSKYITYNERVRLQHVKAMYRPLPPDEVRRIKERELVEVQFGEMLGDLAMYLVYIVALYWVVLASRDSLAYLSTKNMENMVITGAYSSGPDWHSIQSMDDLIEYLNETLIPGVHSDAYYNGDPLNKSGWTADHNILLLGIPRLRQQRILESNTCNVMPAFNKTFSKCLGEYNVYNKETGDFSIGWIPPTTRYEDLDHKATDPWLYRSSLDTLALPWVGEFGYYSGGGYVAELGRTKFNSRLVLKFLLVRNWFDDYTRAVFVEFATYNANRNLFNVVILTAERGAAGAWYTWQKIYTVKLLAVQQQLGILSFLVLIVCILVLVLHFWRQISKARGFKHFLTNIWNIMDIMIILIVIICVVLYYVRSVYVYSLMKRLEDADGNEFVSFFLAAYWDVLLTYLIAVLVGISTARLWKLLHFGSKFRHFERTLTRAAGALQCLIIILAMILATFVTVAMLLIGSLSASFRNVSVSISTLLSLALGFGDMETDVEAFWQSEIGPFFFFAYCAVSLVYMLNMFITVIVISYETSQLLDAEVATHHYGPFDYLLDQLRYYCSCRKKPVGMQPRLRGGADAPRAVAAPRRKRATPKRDDVRNTNALVVPKDKLKAMKLLTLDAIKHGINEDKDGDGTYVERKPSSERLEAMKAITVDRAKEDGDVKRETEAFYRGRDGRIYMFIPESTLQEMEVIVNGMDDPNVEEGEENVADVPAEDGDDGDSSPVFREIDDMEMLKVKLDTLAKLLDDLSSEDGTQDENPELGRGDTRKEPDVAEEPKAVEKPAEKIVTQEEDKEKPAEKVVAQEEDKEKPAEKVVAQEEDKEKPAEKVVAQEEDKEKPAEKVVAQKEDKEKPAEKVVAQEEDKEKETKETPVEDIEEKPAAVKKPEPVENSDRQPVAAIQKPAEKNTEKKQMVDKATDPKENYADDSDEENEENGDVKKKIDPEKSKPVRYILRTLPKDYEYICVRKEDTPVKTSSDTGLEQPKNTEPDIDSKKVTPYVDKEPITQSSPITDQTSQKSPINELAPTGTKYQLTVQPERPVMVQQTTQSSPSTEYICVRKEDTPVKTNSETGLEQRKETQPYIDSKEKVTPYVDKEPLPQSSPKTDQTSQTTPINELEPTGTKYQLTAQPERPPTFPERMYQLADKGKESSLRNLGGGENADRSEKDKPTEEAARNEAEKKSEIIGGELQHRRNKPTPESVLPSSGSETASEGSNAEDQQVPPKDDDKESIQKDVGRREGKDKGATKSKLRGVNDEEGSNGDVCACDDDDEGDYGSDRGDSDDYGDADDETSAEEEEKGRNGEMKTNRAKESRGKEEKRGSRKSGSERSKSLNEEQEEDDSDSDDDDDDDDDEDSGGEDESSESSNDEEIKGCKCGMKASTPKEDKGEKKDRGSRKPGSKTSVPKTESKKGTKDDETKNKGKEDDSDSDSDSDDDDDDDEDEGDDDESSESSNDEEITRCKCGVIANNPKEDKGDKKDGGSKKPGSKTSVPKTESKKQGSKDDETKKEGKEYDSDSDGDSEDNDDDDDDEDGGGGGGGKSSESSNDEEITRCKCGVKTNKPKGK